MSIAVFLVFACLIVAAIMINAAMKKRSGEHASLDPQRGRPESVQDLQHP